jgi:signal transduction histidine kinase
LKLLDQPSGTRLLAGPARRQPLAALQAPDAGLEAMALLDGDGFILAVSQAWRTALAQGANDVRASGVGAPYVEACEAAMPGVDVGRLREGLHALVAGDVQSFRHHYSTGEPAGSTQRQIDITRLRIGAVTQFIAIHRDRTGGARAAAALSTATEQLLSAQEDERARIALELHDTTGQHLAAVGLGISRLRRLLGRQAALQRILDEMNASIDEAHKEIRVLSYLLNTPSPLAGGLEATLFRFVKGFGRRTGLHAVFRVDGALSGYSPEIEHAALRIVQEALSNVHRHAEATGVAVTILVRNDQMTIRIADDGMGIEPLRKGDADGIPLGVGIAGMRSN